MAALSSSDCLFCNVPQERVVEGNELAYAVRDGYPVTPGHTLVIPGRHVADYFGLSAEEREAIHELIVSQKDALLESDDSIQGFNIGANCGQVAGQTIFHCHIHLIPRRDGDVENPRGGVRHTIPGKGNY